jgi:hypothetical protein
MKKSLFAAALCALIVLGLSPAVIAQTSDSSSSPAMAPKVDEPSSAPAAQAPNPSPSSSSSTPMDVKPDNRSGSAGGGDVAASPRTSGESRRFFGLEPTAAVLIAAAIFVVVILALVAMTRGGSETSSHTDIDFDRRR